jgi:hypothetical protein
MALAADPVVGKARSFPASALGAPLRIGEGPLRLSLERDGSVRSFDSLSEKRAIFGYEGVLFYKVQAGVVVQAKKPEWQVTATPSAARFAGRVFDGVEASQAVTFHHGASSGYLRRLSLRGTGPSPVRLRVLCISDPSAARLDGGRRGWGSLGMNVFNRESHLAMDEVSEPPSARLAGAVPSPTRFFLTPDLARAQDAVGMGELPERSAGMSGQVITLSQHDLELAPGSSNEVAFVWLYHPETLEVVLSEFSRVKSAQTSETPSVPFIACSNPAVTEAAAWAVQGVGSSPYAEDILDRAECLPALSSLFPGEALKAIAGFESELRKDGAVPHSSDRAKPGTLETALVLDGAARHISALKDKKVARAHYANIKKMASFLMGASKGHVVFCDPSVPNGWRRRLGRGYPSGEVPEVSLATAAALASASLVARLLSKQSDSLRWKEEAEMLSARVKDRLVDERGYLSLCLESSGRLRPDETVDMAVAGARHPFSRAAEQAACHRLLEDDFQTDYGCRTVPTSNPLYYNAKYGEGQLGGYWTRGALSHSLLCYRLGLGGLASLGLEKAAKIPAGDWSKVGSSPGEFPYWVDIGAHESHGDASDPVSAARFVECLAGWELGLLQPGAGAPSRFSWAAGCGLWAGEEAGVFVGRQGGKEHRFAAGGGASRHDFMSFAQCERAAVDTRDVAAISFWGPGQVVCVGSWAQSAAKAKVTFAARAQELKGSGASLEAYDPEKRGWAKKETLKVLPELSFEAHLGPGDWKAFRVSPI